MLYYPVRLPLCFVFLASQPQYTCHCKSPTWKWLAAYMTGYIPICCCRSRPNACCYYIAQAALILLSWLWVCVVDEKGGGRGLFGRQCGSQWQPSPLPVCLALSSSQIYTSYIASVQGVQGDQCKQPGRLSRGKWIILIYQWLPFWLPTTMHSADATRSNSMVEDKFGLSSGDWRLWRRSVWSVPMTISLFP